MESPAVYARTKRNRFLDELLSFVRFASISAQPQHAYDVRRCAEWLASHLRQIGLEHVHVIPTARHPVVTADWRHAPDRPTVLIYGHYDVQPVDPIQEWKTPPFEPAVRDGNLYGRGASDDKGQLFCHVKALEAYLRAHGRLPVNVVCVFEGEEEIGSPNLKPWLIGNRNRLNADVAVMSDTRFLAPGRPAITYALRGNLSVELEVCSLPRDVHSGSYGGAVHNPIQVLCELVAHMHDEQGRITMPGFYASVRRWSQAERGFMARHGPSDEQIVRDSQARVGWGERGYSAYERTTIRPALTINGVTGGYRGPGSKGIIPACAAVKIGFRLAPDQDPDEIEGLFRRYVSAYTPLGVASRVTVHSKARPALLDRRHPAMGAASLAYRRSFGVAPVFLRSGGSIPVVNTFQEVLGIPTVLMGFALPDDGMHAPNEKFALSQFFGGITACIHFLAACAQALTADSTQRLLHSTTAEPDLGRFGVAQPPQNNGQHSHDR